MLDENGQNSENTYPMWVDLLPSDPQFDMKKEVFLEESDKGEQSLFRLVESLAHETMRDFLSWCRFIVYDGDMNKLYAKH